MNHLSSENHREDNCLELQGNTEEVKDVLDSSDGTQTIHDSTSLELTNSGIFKDQDDTLVAVHEGSFSDLTFLKHIRLLIYLSVFKSMPHLFLLCGHVSRPRLNLV